MTDTEKHKVAPTILTRIYDAPINLVFAAWTQVEHLQRWQFPFKGFKCEFIRADIRAGGESLHKLVAPNGFELFLLTRYEVIRKPDCVIFRQYNANSSGEIVPNPQIPNWPAEMQTQILLQPLGEQTELKLVWQPIDATAEEIAVFEQTRPDHDKGWGSGLEMLASFLAEQ